MHAAVKHSVKSTVKPKVAKQAFFQPKLKMGAANDVFEQEADRMANTVVGQNTNVLQAKKQELPVLRFFNPKSHQRKAINTEEEEKLPKGILRKETGAATNVSDDFEEQLSSSKMGGRELPQQVKQEMETGFGADFSGVRIHTGGSSEQLNNQVAARAFTVGNNIYFNRGQYQPQSTQGRKLLAHELTHTIQQGASPQQNQTVQKTPTKVQRGIFSAAWKAVSGKVSGAVDWADDQLGEAITWLKRKASDFAANIPGYFAMSVILGQDPISGGGVPRNGTNFIRAGISLIPGGNLLWQRLQQKNIVQDAAAFLDKKLATTDLNLPGVLGELAAIWRSLGISDVRNPRAVLKRVSDVFISRIQKTLQFAVDVGRYFLGILKAVVIKELAKFVKSKTRFYPLLQFVLGYDPISNERIARTPKMAIQALLELTPQGAEIYRQLESSGALARALTYTSNLYTRVLALVLGVKTNILRLWNLAGVNQILYPLETFMQAFGIFLQIAGSIPLFVFSVVRDFLGFVKDALLSYLKKYGEKIPGYHLLTVILGKDPITQEPVTRTPKNLIKGFFMLIPGGMKQYKQLEEMGAINKILAWIGGAVKALGLVFIPIKLAILNLWNLFTWSNLASPIRAFKQIFKIIRKPIIAVKNFVVRVVKKVIYTLFELMNMPVSLIKKIMKKVLKVVKTIARSPINFLRNLLSAIRLGFFKFFKNIAKHLKNGLSKWLFGQLKNAGISIPNNFSLKSILKMVFQISGITVNNILARIRRRIGPEKLARLQRAKNRLTGAWGFVTDVIRNGPVALLKWIRSKVTNLWKTVFDSARNWIVTKIIREMTLRITLMLNPAGAIINTFSALFRVVQTAVQNAKAILSIIGVVANGVVKIAQGSIALAAQFLENALAKALPIVISFLANLMGLGGLSRKIREIITGAYSLVSNAIDWLIDRAVKWGSRVL